MTWTRTALPFALSRCLLLIIYLTDVTSRLASTKCDCHCSATKQHGIAAGTNWRRGGISDKAVTVRGKLSGEWRRLRSEEHNDLCLPNNVQVMKSKE
jgi:hypothetical protein